MKEIPFLQVNDQKITMGDVVSRLKLSGLMSQVETEMINVNSIKKAAEEANISVSDDELQRVVDDKRYRLGLESADDTYQWLDEKSLTVEDLEHYCEFLILRDKFKHQLTEGKTEEYFAKNKLSFEKAEVSQILVSDHSTAKELLTQVRDEGADFELLAYKYSLDQKSGCRGGYLGSVGHNSLKPEWEAAIFGARAGEVIGPFESDEGFHLIRVHSVQRPELEEVGEDMVREMMLSEWLEQGRTGAKIDYSF